MSLPFSLWRAVACAYQRRTFKTTRMLLELCEFQAKDEDLDVSVLLQESFCVLQPQVQCNRFRGWGCSQEVLAAVVNPTALRGKRNLLSSPWNAHGKEEWCKKENPPCPRPLEPNCIEETCRVSFSLSELGGLAELGHHLHHLHLH